MKTIFKFLLVLILIFINPIALFSQWVQTNGPHGGYVYTLAYNGTDLLAGTLSGIFLSTNNGTSWTSANSNITNIYGVSSIAVNGTSIFASTQDGVYLSTNKGSSWVAIDSGLNINVYDFTVNVLAINGTNLFAGGESGSVFLSTDNGKSWTAVNSGLPYSEYPIFCFYRIKCVCRN